jgi:YVTN family beta-propeller protein
MRHRPAAGLFAALAVLGSVAALSAEESAPSSAVGGLTVAARVRTASQPKGVSLSPDGRTLVVTNFGQRWDRSIYLYDAATLERTGQIDVPDSNVVESVWSPDGAVLYVSDFTNHRVLFIDPAERKVVRELVVDDHPKVLALSPDGATLYASCWAGGTVVAVDTATAAETGRVEVGRHPRGIAVAPDGARLWVVTYGGDELVELAAAPLAVTRRLALPADSRPRHVVRDAAGARLWISAKGRNVVFAVDVAAWAVTAEVPVGGCPKTIALAPDERVLYVADYCSDEVSVLDVAAGTAIQLPLDGIREPSGLVLRSDGARLWVTGWSSKDLWALDPTAAPPP